MKRRLLLKSALGYLLFAVLSFAVIATLSYRLLYNNDLDFQARRLRTEVRAISDRFSAVYRGKADPDENHLNQLRWLAEAEGWRSLILDESGVVIFDSSGSLVGSEIPEFDPLTTESYLIDAYPQLGKGWCSVFCTIISNLQVRGYAILSMPLAPVRSLALSQLRPVFLTFAIIFALSFIILIVQHFTVTRPLRRIAKAADMYAHGDFKHRIAMKRSDEIGYLAATLDAMAGDLDAAEESQRQFISNISHDFRSPLTSIKGYLEAIRDGVIPPEEQEHYINVVISEADRLADLSRNILNLSTLGNGAMTLDLSDFDINSVIKDTCASFEGQCAEKDMDFDLYFDAEQSMVHADKARIQQVLYNLIDNAIKFSGNGTTITIDVSSRADRIFISVRDQGIGISRDEIGRIWDRFYKTDASRGKDKKGTGLGLSIVKEIITAHGETIDVVSTEGAGTEFIFRLKKSV